MCPLMTMSVDNATVLSVIVVGIFSLDHSD